MIIQSSFLKRLTVRNRDTSKNLDIFNEEIEKQLVTSNTSMSELMNSYAIDPDKKYFINKFSSWYTEVGVV